MFKWTPYMQVDSGPIDEDHIKLISIANRVLELNQPNQNAEELKQVIRELYDYVKYHFSREEDFMTRLSFPGIEEHKQKHMLIVEEMNHYLTKSHHLNDMLNNFQELVNKWVITHIMEEDKKIHKFMEDKLKAARLQS